MLLALVSPVFAGLLVNEVVYDPSGTDDGLEWIELCNNGADTVDLTGYAFHNAGSSYGDIYTFASGSLAPGEYLLVGGTSATHPGSFSPNIQNGGTETDGLRLVDASGTVVDTVLYDESNAVLAEDDGTIPTTGAPAATNGKSIGRFPDCADTNVSESDFVLYDTPSALAANVDPNDGGEDTGVVVSVDCAGADGVVINELMPNPSGSDSGGEWIEVRNNGATAVTLDGWLLQWDTSSFDSAANWTFPAATTLEPGAYVVVGAGGLAASLSFGNAGSSADAVRIACDGAAVDTVIYGTTNTDAFADDTGIVALSLAPKPTEGDSLQRMPDGLDTDVCGVDFISGAATPGAENTTGPVGDADCTGSEDVVVNELVYSTDVEWVELYNAGAGPVLLDGWVLEFGTSSYTKDAELPAGTTLGPGEWLVIGSAGALTKDIELDLDMGNASDTDALRLTCNTLPVDTVLYGDPNENAWTDDSGAVATSLAPDHGTGESIGRISDGFDTDQCGVDFAVQSVPTPGGANPVIEPEVCETDGATSLKLNEFIYDPDGTDGGNEWVELYNAGSVELRLDGYTIQTAGTDWGEDFRFPGGVSLAPGEFMLVGGEDVDGADFVAPDLSIDNASSGAGGLRVVDCEANVLDTVLYGDDIEDPISGDAGSNEVVPKVSSSVSLGRFPDGEDSNAAADWIPYSDPTPGTPNADPAAVGDDTGTGGPGGGCNDKENGPPAPGEGGCNTVLPLGGLEVGIAALLLLRRRRS
ncbi:MAG: lamin tail domain-containing protein [Pseudomonadota bacterium]|nr:lamin tail domain-containing protein [Pseudomonadota bacterium]